MKNSTKVIAGIVVVVAIIAISIVVHNNRLNQESAEIGAGHLYVAVTDATADIQNVSDIDLSIEKIELYDATNGWMTLSSDARTYPLLALQQSGSAKLYASKNDVPARTYDRVRVTLGGADVRTKAGGTVKAVMPAKEVVFDANVKVAADMNTRLLLDFKADKSLHTAGADAYVFAPVVEVRSESGAMVSVAADSTVAVSGGMTDTDTTVGMDLSGATKTNFALETDDTLRVKAVTDDAVTFTLGGKDIVSDTGVRDEQSSDIKANTDTMIDVNTGPILNPNSATSPARDGIKEGTAPKINIY